LLEFHTGTGTELAVSQAQTVVEQARANYSAELRGRAQAENALVLLLGQPLPADLPPAVPLNSQMILTDIPAGLPSDLLVRRPDVLQAESTLRAGNANIGAARAAFFPTISLTGDFGTGVAHRSRGFSSPVRRPGALLRPSPFQSSTRAACRPAWTWRSCKRISTSRSTKKRSRRRFREVADGLAARGTYDDEVASLERTTQAQQRSLDLSEMRFRNGVDNYLTVLTAQTGLYSAQQALVAARLARLTNLVDLYRFLGGGWIEHTGDGPRPAEDAGAPRNS